MSDHAFFGTEFKAAFEDLLTWRRDVRHFSTQPVPTALIDQLLSLACLAPSVGFSQPWRFVKVESEPLRQAVIADYEASKQAAAALYSGEKAALYHELKLSGLREAPVHLAVFCDKATGTGHGLGQQTMPQTLGFSVVCAIHTLWLAAHMHGLGLGWVSIMQPEKIQQLLDVPAQWEFVAYLNLGWPVEAASMPELEERGWEKRQALRDVVFQR